MKRYLVRLTLYGTPFGQPMYEESAIRIVGGTEFSALGVCYKRVRK